MNTLENNKSPYVRMRRTEHTRGNPVFTGLKGYDFRQVVDEQVKKRKGYEAKEIEDELR